MYITNDMVKAGNRLEFVVLLTRQAELLADLETCLDAIECFCMKSELETIETRMESCMV